MRANWTVVAGAGCLLASPNLACANDSTANLAAGGLVLTKSSTVEMRSEDLYISQSAVRVKYAFVNTASKDVTVTVAFPLPDIALDDVTPFDDLPDIPDQDSANFLGFQTTVDGKPAPMRLEQKAMVGDVDYAATLTGLHVPLAPERAATTKALDALPRAKQNRLVKLGVAQDDGSVSSPTAKLRLVPAWTLKTTFYWMQTFPAGRAVRVEHDYSPSVGNFVSTYLTLDPATLNSGEAETRRQEIGDYCVDDSLIAALKAAAQKAGGGAGPFYEVYVDYILTTGANWKSPIGDFTMTIDKGAASNLVSFCGDGVKKTGPTTFQVHYADYTPTKDVKVLILTPRP